MPMETPRRLPTQPLLKSPQSARAGERAEATQLHDAHCACRKPHPHVLPWSESDRGLSALGSQPRRFASQGGRL